MEHRPSPEVTRPLPRFGRGLGSRQLRRCRLRAIVHLALLPGARTDRRVSRDSDLRRCAPARRHRTAGQAKRGRTASSRRAWQVEAPPLACQWAPRSRVPELTRLRRLERPIAAASAARSIATRASAGLSGPAPPEESGNASTARDVSRSARRSLPATLRRSTPRSSPHRGTHRRRSHAPLPR